MPGLDTISEGRRRQMIADAAYFRAERRGFGGGDPVEDWLEAEAEVDARLREVEGGGLLDRLEERLATVNERLAALQRKVARMKADARGEWKTDLDKLARLRDSLTKRLEEIREHGGDAGERAQKRAEKVWDEITEIIQRTYGRRKSAPRPQPGAAASRGQAAENAAPRPKAAGGKPRTKK